jgi:hypothetical protein
LGTPIEQTSAHISIFNAKTLGIGALARQKLNQLQTRAPAMQTLGG